MSIRPESFEHQSAAFSDCFFWLAMDTSDAQAGKNIVSDARCCYSTTAASGCFKICIIRAFYNRHHGREFGSLICVESLT